MTTNENSKNKAYEIQKSNISIVVIGVGEQKRFGAILTDSIIYTFV
jgi:hypothetical protein